MDGFFHVVIHSVSSFGPYEDIMQQTSQFLGLSIAVAQTRGHTAHNRFLATFDNGSRYRNESGHDSVGVKLEISLASCI